MFTYFELISYDRERNMWLCIAKYMSILDPIEYIHIPEYNQRTNKTADVSFKCKSHPLKHNIIGEYELWEII